MKKKRLPEKKNRIEKNMEKKIKIATKIVENSLMEKLLLKLKVVGS